MPVVCYVVSTEVFMAASYYVLKVEGSDEKLWEGKARDVAEAINEARAAGADIPSGMKLRVSYVSVVEIDKNGNPKG